MKFETIEHFGGDFGVTVIFTQDSESYAHCSFFAARITALEQADGADGPFDVPCYEQDGALNSMETTTDPRKAERYIGGTVKWDGCSHVYFGRSDGYLHICGVEDWTKLATFLPLIYERCGELMEARGCSVLEGEFKCRP